MNAATESEISTFLSKIEDFFSDLEKWSSEVGLTTTRGSVEVSEEILGTYSAPTLTIIDSTGESIAEAVPIGRSIVGANGRVDLNGTYDKAILLALSEGGPSLHTTVTEGSHVEQRTKKIYQGVTEAGWYWIERTARLKGNAVTKDLFLYLLSQVSDYECS